MGTSDVARRGFDDAVSRLRQWVDEGDYQDPTPFVDALGNMYILENSHRKRLGNARYFAHRAADSNGPVVGGIVYARGLSAHLDAEGAEIVGARPFRLDRSQLDGRDQLDGPGVSLVWRPFVELPSPDRPETHGRDLMYQQRVEGREVLSTLQDVSQFFNGVESLT